MEVVAPVQINGGGRKAAQDPIRQEQGGVPVPTLKVHAEVKILGHPVWKWTVQPQMADKQDHQLRSIHKTMQEMVYGAFNGWLAELVRARTRPQQRAGVLSRIVLWNVLAQVYHLG